MGGRIVVAGGVALLLAGLSAAGVTDRPRPDAWETFGELKRQVDAGLAALPDYLRSLEPEAFAARHATLAKMARSADAAERSRALRAIAVLRDPGSVSLLVEAFRESACDERDLSAAVALSDWIYEAYRSAGNVPPRLFEPLLPLFVKTVVEAGDLPNVRSHCFQAIGCLADSAWLPLVKELADSRHPAVTHWSAWAVEQLSGRAPQTDAVEIVLKDRRMETTYTLPPLELDRIAGKVRGRLAEPAPQPAQGDVVFYSTGIAHFDGWIPTPGQWLKQPPDAAFHYRWLCREGRVVRVDAIESGRPDRLVERVWYNALGGPILSADYRDNEPASVRWGDYDRAGLLKRVVRMSVKMEGLWVDVFSNGPKYCHTVQYGFGPDGRLVVRTQYVEGQVVVLDRTGGERVVNQGHRLKFLCRPEDHGLSSYYPIPAGPTPEDPSDATGSQLRIADLKVNPAGVEEQCTGTVVIRNAGRDYPQTPSGKICDSYMLRIYDSHRRLVFRAGGAWSGPIPSQGERSFRFDTHSNTLHTVGPGPFLFPATGRYTLQVTVVKGGSERFTDIRSVSFCVGRDAAEFRLIP